MRSLMRCYNYWLVQPRRQPSCAMPFRPTTWWRRASTLTRPSHDRRVHLIPVRDRCFPEVVANAVHAPPGQYADADKDKFWRTTRCCKLNEFPRENFGKASHSTLLSTSMKPCNKSWWWRTTKRRRSPLKGIETPTFNLPFSVTLWRTCQMMLLILEHMILRPRPCVFCVGSWYCTRFRLQWSGYGNLKPYSSNVPDAEMVGGLSADAGDSWQNVLWYGGQRCCFASTGVESSCREGWSDGHVEEFISLWMR